MPLKKTKTKLYGMTLVELMLIIAIIGIFAGFLYPTTSRAYTNIKVSRTKMAMVQVASLLEIYYNEYHIYPDALQSLDAIGINIDELPLDPFNPNDSFFQYFTNRYPYKGSYYAPGDLYGLSSYGPDGDGDVQALDEEGDVIALPGETYPSEYTSSYDAMMYQFDAGGYTSYDNPYEATQDQNYSDGDLIVFGPVQVSQLKERYDPVMESWNDLPWYEYEMEQVGNFSGN